MLATHICIQYDFIYFNSTYSYQDQISYDLVDYWYFVPSIVLSTDTRSQATVNLSYCSQMVHNIVK